MGARSNRTRYMSKKILMIAGPNGAGKTTMTFELMKDCETLDGAIWEKLEETAYERRV